MAMGPRKCKAGRLALRVLLCWLVVRVLQTLTPGSSRSSISVAWYQYGTFIRPRRDMMWCLLLCSSSRADSPKANIPPNR